MKNNSGLLTFIFGVILSVFLFLSWRSCHKKDEAALINQDYYLITNQIKNMNKMIVTEQDFSSFLTHKSSVGNIAGFEILPREMVLYSTAKAQVTYDLKKMKIDVDTINKKLIITEIPQPEIQIFPDVKIHFMDDYAINRFSHKEINSVMESAKKNMVNSVNQNSLKQQSQKQLKENLNDIFVLAKALHYSIEDKTNTFPSGDL